MGDQYTRSYNPDGFWPFADDGDYDDDDDDLRSFN
jgi:hypothetical protein